MAGKASDLLSLLDGDLETLQKAMAGDQASEEDEDMEDPDHEEDEDEDQADDDEEDEEEDEEDEEEDSEGKSALRKSLEADDNMEKALEVSDFLSALVDEIGYGQEGLEKSLMKVSKNQNTLIKSISTLVDVVKTQHGQIEDLQKSLNEVLQRPVGRRGAVSQVELQTIKKGLSTEETRAKKPLTRMQISDILFKSFEANEISGNVVSKFEAGVPLNSLNLPESVQKRLGM